MIQCGHEGCDQMARARVWWLATSETRWSAVNSDDHRPEGDLRCYAHAGLLRKSGEARGFMVTVRALTPEVIAEYVAERLDPPEGLAW